jgi:predicted O-methyltransferase YrrM
VADSSWSPVDAYLEGLFVAGDPALEQVLRESARAGLPAIQVSPLQGRMLEILARVRGAKQILEVGALGGYSTLCLARALPSDGRLVSLELEPRHAELARSSLQRAGFSDRTEVRVGPAADSMAELIAEKRGPFDFIFIDADKPNYPAYLEWSLRLSASGTLIIADNVVRDGRVLRTDGADPNVEGVRRFLHRLGSEPRVRATAVQTVGRKGYDGFAIAVVA